MIFPNGSEPIPGWRVRFPVQGGTTGECYRVVDSEGTLAFLKVFAQARMTEDRFDSTGQLLEVAILRALDHAGIPRFIESGVASNDELAFVVMELVPGETLDRRLARDFAFPAHQARSLMEGLTGIAAYLHALEDPVIHNQITPANVILHATHGEEERPILIDFDHSRRSSDEPAELPTDLDPYYLPNECYEGAVLSPATDVFALGATYYRILFGMPPWDLRAEKPKPGDDLREALLKARLRPLPVPLRTVGGELDASTLGVIRKALHPSPEARFGSAAAFLAALTAGTRPATRLRRDGVSSGAMGGRSKPTGFAAVAGMDDLKDTLRRDVINALDKRDEYGRYGLSIPSGLLLYGPPGCGKTFVAERFGEELGLPFRTITPGSVASVYKSGTQERIARLFDEARREAPCVLFLDEMDALVPSRDGDLHYAYAVDVNEWLTQMSGCGEAEVFLVAATNQPRRIDPAVLRAGRIDRIVYVGPPDHAAREAMFEIHLVHRPVGESVDYSELARLTKGRVAADIKLLVDEAARATLARGSGDIGMRQLVDAIERTGPSVSAGVLEGYEKMRREFEPERSGTPSARRIGFHRQENGDQTP